MNYFLALDMGGTNLKTALVSEDNINARDWNFEIFSTPSKASVTDNCDAVAAALEKTLSELPPGDQIAAVGISGRFPSNFVPGREKTAEKAGEKQ